MFEIARFCFRTKLSLPCFARGNATRLFAKVLLILFFVVFVIPLQSGCNSTADKKIAFLKTHVKQAFFNMDPFFVESCFIWEPKHENASKFGVFSQFIFSEDDSFKITTSGTPAMARSFADWRGILDPTDLVDFDEKIKLLNQPVSIRNSNYFATIHSTDNGMRLEHIEQLQSRAGREMLFWGFCTQEWIPYWELSLEEWTITSVPNESNEQIQFLFARKDGQSQEDVVFSRTSGRCVSREITYQQNGVQAVQEHQFQYADDTSVIPKRIDIKMDGQDIGFVESRNFTKIAKIDPSAFRLSAYGLNEPPLPKSNRMFWLVAGGILGVIGVAMLFWFYQKRRR